MAALAHELSPHKAILIEARTISDKINPGQDLVLHPVAVKTQHPAGNAGRESHPECWPYL
jgi:hypothetical protein